MRIIQLSYTKPLPNDFTKPWLKYFVKMNKANPPLEGVDVSGFSNEEQHGRQILVSMLGNQMIYQQLLSLKMKDCGAFWQSFREEGFANFAKLLDLLVACECLVEIDLGHNGLNGEQLQGVIQAVRRSLSMRFLKALHLDKNRPVPSLA